MRTILVRYQTHPDRADDNERLIRAVFDELAGRKLPGLRYAALRLPDATFYHLVVAKSEASRSALVELPAFQSFQAGIKDRCVEAPVSNTLAIVGNHHLIGG